MVSALCDSGLRELRARSAVRGEVMELASFPARESSRATLREGVAFGWYLVALSE